jgi:hypothetical protein
MARKAYRCPGCGEETIIDEGEPVPECCGDSMHEISIEDCTKPHNAESARFEDEDGACDEGVR